MPTHCHQQSNQAMISHPKIINLSSFPLTIEQKQILLEGLKFTPTPQRNVNEMKRDIDEFTRKLRLREYFYSENNNEGEQIITPLVNPKSTFNPPRNRNNTLDITIDFLQKQKFPVQVKNSSNLSKKEWLGLMSLKNNEGIIIKEADKGGSVIIMNKDHYAKMI